MEYKYKNILPLFGNFLAEALFPAFCYNCKNPREYLCEECFWKLTVLYEPACPHCEIRLPFGELPKECRGEIKLHRIFACGLYSDKSLNSLLKDLKYKGAHKLAEPLAQFAYWHLEQGDYIKTIKENVDLIIPVPLYIKNLKRRGFNHAELIAEHLSKKFDIPMRSDVLIKTKKTDAQVEAGSRENRQKNLTDAFDIHKPTHPPVEPVGEKPTGSTGGQNPIVLLVDDVVTTGSTLRECAKVLRKRADKNTPPFAKEVWGLTIVKD